MVGCGHRYLELVRHSGTAITGGDDDLKRPLEVHWRGSREVARCRFENQPVRQRGATHKNRRQGTDIVVHIGEAVGRNDVVKSVSCCDGLIYQRIGQDRCVVDRSYVNRDGAHVDEPGAVIVVNLDLQRVACHAVGVGRAAVFDRADASDIGLKVVKAPSQG